MVGRALGSALDRCLGDPLILLGRQPKVGAWLMLVLALVVVLLVKIPYAERFGQDRGADVDGLAASGGHLPQGGAVPGVLLERRRLHVHVGLWQDYKTRRNKYDMKSSDF